jgi:hypothetical protein
MLQDVVADHDIEPGLREGDIRDVYPDCMEFPEPIGVKGAAGVADVVTFGEDPTQLPFR